MNSWINSHNKFELKALKFLGSVEQVREQTKQNVDQHSKNWSVVSLNTLKQTLLSVEMTLAQALFLCRNKYLKHTPVSTVKG
jgi:transcription termination factor NusB